ncbi:MAG TPA: HNH endonuclease signature motif containing protein [Planctomycetota bacterium]|nr:HNH endonuclease signature motif containing protein [Planctomycetota bacterium]
MVELTDKNIKNFWKKVDKKGEDECWEWTACKNKYNYGQFQINYKMYLSHRISWILENGDIPENYCICHSCDNPLCCNPNHLFLGTHKDNIADRDKKGRQAIRNGIKNGRHILTEKEVLEIRQKYIPYKYSQQKLADEYGVCNQLVSCIINNKIWKHI